MAKINDQQLIDQIKNGNTKAFTVLVDQYKDLVFTLALRMVKNREEAEEISQDTFVKIYTSLNKFNGDSKFSTWIYKVTYNTCVDRLKKYKREQNVVTIDEFTERQVKTVENALDIIEEQERKEAITACLNLLSSDDSFLLSLFYFEELSLEEIAKIVGIKANHVKIKLFRSRKKLFKLFKERLEPEMIYYYENERR